MILFIPLIPLLINIGKNIIIGLVADKAKEQIEDVVINKEKDDNPSPKKNNGRS